MPPLFRTAKTTHLQRIQLTVKRVGHCPTKPYHPPIETKSLHNVVDGVFIKAWAARLCLCNCSNIIVSSIDLSVHVKKIFGNNYCKINRLYNSTGDTPRRSKHPKEIRPQNIVSRAD